jgi:hypothetical protein
VRPSVNTFDVFDTLIARRGVGPHAALDRLEAAAGMPGLKAARLAADRRLWDRGRPYTLADLWDEVRAELHLDAASAARLLELEVRLEHAEVVPVAANLALVRDGDVLVSDTYLPAAVVRALLRRAGLAKEVALVVSNDGKSSGRVWAELQQQVTIRQHLGDNPESDGRRPGAAGVRAVITTAAKRTPVEQMLAGQGWPDLADLVREARLANLPPEDPARRHLGALGCQLNFPLLYLASLALERHCRAAGAREVLFVSRDCWLWRRLFARLFPQRPAAYLYSSRRCLFRPTADYLAYFKAAWHPDAVVVDLLSTGASWAALLARLGVKGKFFFIGAIDDYAYAAGAARPAEWLEAASVFRTSELGRVPTKAVEMLNYAPHGRVEDVRLLPGGVALPVLAEQLEYDAALPETVGEAFAACLKALEHYPELLRPQPGVLAEVIKALALRVCADPQLHAIYAGHREHDEAYVREIFATGGEGG